MVDCFGICEFLVVYHLGTGCSIIKNIAVIHILLFLMIPLKILHGIFSKHFNYVMYISLLFRWEI